MGDFAASIKAFKESTRVRGSKVLRYVALSGLRGLLLRSPVDTGRFRGNWRVGINESVVKDSKEVTDLDPKGKGPSKTFGRESAKLSPDSVRWGDSIHISNSVPYAIMLEFGWSPQAPGGILRPTFLELKKKFDSAVAATDYLTDDPGAWRVDGE